MKKNLLFTMFLCVLFSCASVDASKKVLETKEIGTDTQDFKETFGKKQIVFVFKKPKKNQEDKEKLYKLSINEKIIKNSPEVFECFYNACFRGSFIESHSFTKFILIEEPLPKNVAQLLMKMFEEYYEFRQLFKRGEKLYNRIGILNQSLTWVEQERVLFFQIEALIDKSISKENPEKDMRDILAFVGKYQLKCFYKPVAKKVCEKLEFDAVVALTKQENDEILKREVNETLKERHIPFYKRDEH